MIRIKSQEYQTARIFALYIVNYDKMGARPGYEETTPSPPTAVDQEVSADASSGVNPMIGRIGTFCGTFLKTQYLPDVI